MSSLQSTCSKCKLTGLPVFVTIYAVLPAELRPELPAGITAARVKDVPVDVRPALPAGHGLAGQELTQAQHQLKSARYGYGLRVVRRGYVYVFYESNFRGSNLWEVYTVHGDGCLLLQPSPEMAELPEKELSCSTSGHSKIRTNYFVIERPEECGTTWVAFSEHKWTTQTLANYAGDAALRARRMQSINPKTWIATKTDGSGHVVEATPEKVAKVQDYLAGIDTVLTPRQAGSISKADGSFESRALSRQASIYPVQIRHGQETQLVKQMHASGLRPDGKSHPPVLMGLWDAIGITHELQGFCAEVPGRVEQYQERERSLEITAFQLTSQAQKVLEDAAADKVTLRHNVTKEMTRSRQYGPAGIARLRKLAATHDEPQRSHCLEMADLLEKWEPQHVPSRYAHTLDQMLLAMSRESAWRDPAQRPHRMAQHRAEMDKLKAQVATYLQKRDPSRTKEVEQARNWAWAPQYESLINRAALDTFGKNYGGFLTVCGHLLEARTSQLVKWLSSPLLVDTLEDYDTKDLGCGVALEGVVADAIFGIGACASGRRKLDEWLKALNAVDNKNLFWRAFALNQTELRADVTAVLTTAKASLVVFTEADFDRTLESVKVIKKIGDAYKKAVKHYSAELSKAQKAELKAAEEAERAKPKPAEPAAGSPGHDANRNRGSLASDQALSQRLKVHVASGDRLIMNVGDRFFKLFHIDKGLDSLGERLVQHLFNLRAMVHDSDSISFVKGDAKLRLEHRLLAKKAALAESYLEAEAKYKKDYEKRVAEGRAPHQTPEENRKRLDDLYTHHTREFERKAQWDIAKYELQVRTEARANPKSTMNRLWAEFLDTPGSGEKVETYLKDRRLALIVGMIEFSNLLRLLSIEAGDDGRRDSRAAWTIVSSAMSVGSAAVDIGAMASKLAMGEPSASHNRLKFYGGMLSSAATWITTVYDIGDARKEWDRGRTTFFALYALKAGLGGADAALVGLAAFGNGAVLVERYFGRSFVVTQVLSRWGLAATARLAGQILFMSLGVWLAIGAAVVQILIWVLNDNELEAWCKQSAFGLEKFKSDRFNNSREQAKRFRDALSEAV